MSSRPEPLVPAMVISLLMSALINPLAVAQPVDPVAKAHRPGTAAALGLVDAVLPLLPQATADDRTLVGTLLHGTGTPAASAVFVIDVAGIDCRYQVGHPQGNQCWLAVGGVPRISVTGPQAKALVRALVRSGATEDAAMGGHREIQITALTCTLNDRVGQGPQASGAVPVSCRFTDPLEG